MPVGNLLRWGCNGDRVLWTDAVTGSCLAMAHMHPASSRAMAPVTTVACWPCATSRRERLQSLTWAFQLLSWMILGGFSSRRGRWRLTWAGEREAQAPATRARRAWVCRLGDRALLASLAGGIVCRISPKHASVLVGDQNGAGRQWRPPWSRPRCTGTPRSACRASPPRANARRSRARGVPGRDAGGVRYVR